MILIADSGSTKTDWAIVTGASQPVVLNTQGINPVHQSREEIVQIVREEFVGAMGSNSEVQKLRSSAILTPEFPMAVYFYGSGVRPELESLMTSLLQETFPQASVIEAHSDLLGAARALCGHNYGIAGILGTGANSCLYDGNDIIQHTPALGYILGDEGSGATIGKTFIKCYLEGRFDAELTKQIFEETGETVTTVLKSVYKGEHPNRYLANFTKIISKHIEHPQMQELMRQSFRDFFGNYLLIYPDYLKYRIGFCGSIAYYFSGILVEELEKLGYSRDNVFIINEVTAELLKYHLG